MLETAIREGNLATVTGLLRTGANPNGRNAQQLTPLMIAAGLGQSQMVELLLTAGAEAQALEPRMGATALHKAAQSGNADVIALLLRHGAFIDQQSPILGHTALMDSVLHKQEEAVCALLEHGAKTAIRSHTQQTALDLAKSDGLDAIANLIEARSAADGERTKSFPWIAAIKTGNIDEVMRLIAAGRTLNERAPSVGGLDDGYTPLGLAAREGQTEIVRLLLNANADIRRVTGTMRGTPVHEASYFGHADALRVLTQGGATKAELDAQGPYNGYTPLHDAVWHGHLEAAHVLVDAGAPLDLRSDSGLTPLALAQRYEYHDLARFLVHAASLLPR
ncbi:ankyrin repeat domain-containing protein [Oxalobacteraceae bacterium OTU3CINTB1]|nr:ankyrin repeat domain-containing protein [Oxalobacteraceae bacterium OTU3CINTB1]